MASQTLQRCALKSDVVRSRSDPQWTSKVHRRTRVLLQYSEVQTSKRIANLITAFSLLSARATTCVGSLGFKKENDLVSNLEDAT